MIRLVVVLVETQTTSVLGGDAQRILETLKSPVRAIEEIFKQFEACDDLTDDGLLGVLPCPDLRSVLMHNCEMLSDHIGDLLIAAPGWGSR